MISGQGGIYYKLLYPPIELTLYQVRLNCPFLLLCSKKMGETWPLTSICRTGRSNADDRQEVGKGVGPGLRDIRPPWSEPRTHGRFNPTCHFERSEKSFPMQMVNISQSLRSFEMTKAEIILIIIKNHPWPEPR
jgi:hypothetical protein